MCGAGVAIGAAALVRAEEARPADEEPVTVTRTEQQLHFQLPPDWPIEKRGGMVVPIPVEEYLAQKLKAIDSRFQVIEQRLNGFDLRLRVLEEGGKKPSQGLKSSEATSP